MSRQIIKNTFLKKNGQLVEYPLGADIKNVVITKTENNKEVIVSTLDKELEEIKNNTDTHFETPTTGASTENLVSGEKLPSILKKVQILISNFLKHLSNSTNGQNHIPAGGQSGNILLWSSTGKAKWGTNNATEIFTGATASTAGAKGLVPAPSVAAKDKFLKGDGSWGTPPGSTYTAGNGLKLNSNQFSVNTIANKKTSSSINWTDADNGKLIATNNTLAYWSGCYNAENTKSNLTHCNQGAFGTAATYNVTETVASGNKDLVTSDAVSKKISELAGFLPLTGGTLSGDLTLSDGNIFVKKGNQTAASQVVLENSLRKGTFSVSAQGTLGIYDTSNGKWLLSSSAGGNNRFDGTSTGLATSKGENMNIGSAINPVYFSNGKPEITAFTLEKSVPREAVFTDTTYSEFKGSGAGLVPARQAMTDTPTKYLREDGQWITPPNTTYTLSSITGTLALAKGGTGATTAAKARTNLGLGTAAIKDVATSVSVSSYDLISSNLLYTTLSSLLNLKIKDSGIVNCQMPSSDINDIIPEFWLSKGTWIIIASGIFSSANQNEKVLISELGIKAGATPGFPVDIPTQYTRLVEKDDTNTGVATLHLTTINTLTEDTRYRLKGKCTLTSSASNVDCVCRIMAIKIPEF